MSLAYAMVPSDTVDRIFSHLRTRCRGYGNMHMRETRTVKGQLQLRYLHAIIADGAQAAVGALSGPGIYVRYRLTHNRLVVGPNVAPPKDHVRLQARFFQELLARVEMEEQDDGDHPLNYASGRFYLRRGRPGSPMDAPACQSALSLKVLDADFLALLQPWNLKLLHPR